MSAAAARQVARAIDELKRGEAVRVGPFDVLAVETADAATLAAFDGDAPADLLLTWPRAATLKIVNQKPAADEGPVRIARAPWMNLANALAAADPARDLATPLKGPYSATPIGDADAAAAGVRLAKLAGLLPAVFVRPARDAALLAADPAAVLAWRSADGLRIAARARLPIEASEDCEIVAFRTAGGGPEHLALVIGDPDRSKPVPARLHSACLTGDLLGSLKCDCGPQLRAALQRIAALGGGVLLYLQQEGRGIGLVNKLRAYALQDQGFDTVDANLRLGFDVDERDFVLAARMFDLLGVREVALLTNNPAKVVALEAEGIRVARRLALHVGEGAHNAAYLATKRARTGHLA